MSRVIFFFIIISYFGINFLEANLPNKCSGLHTLLATADSEIYIYLDQCPAIIASLDIQVKSWVKHPVLLCCDAYPLSI